MEEPRDWSSWLGEGHGASQRLLAKWAWLPGPEEGGPRKYAAVGTAAAAVAATGLVGGLLEGGQLGAEAQSTAAAAADVVGPNGPGGEGVWQ